MTGCRVRSTCALWALAWLVMHPAAALAQNAPDGGRRTAGVAFAASEISIDGKLDEPAWATAIPIGDLVQRQPNPGQPATERTDVRLLHDGNHLYIGITCYDSAPDRIIGTQMTRDAALGSDDRIELLLDTFRDQRNAFYFATNPTGALVDGLAFANGQLSTEWDTIWDVRTMRAADGWTAEFSIPFRSLTFPAGRSVWGFNIARHIYRKLEEVRWSGARLDLQFTQVAEAGEISNLTNLSQGVGVELKPFISTNVRHLAIAGRNIVTGRPGVDMFYNITPSLKLTATVNTDFGETEVDARQINLGRFSLLFPEKRTFFTEDAGVFSFTSTGPQPAGGVPASGADVYPFFSRQIGLLAGEEVPVDFGVKLTGKVGRADVGLLNVRTGEANAPGSNLVVGRVRRNILQQSYVGALFSNGDPASVLSSRTLGADVRLATSRFLGSRYNFVLDAYALRSITEGRPGRDWSWGVSAAYPNDRFNPQVSVREIQENFDPALGFVQRKNVRMMRVGGGFNPRPRRFPSIQQMFHDLYFTHFTRLDTGQTESWDVFLTWLDWHFQSGDGLHSIMDINPIYERLSAPFMLSPGVVLPPGEYRFTRLRPFTITAAAKRKVSGSLTWTTGRYWSGHANQFSAGLTYKLPPKLIVTANANQTRASLPQGSFRATILSARAEYATSPLLSLSNLIQYDDRSNNLGWQSRVRWTLQPGDDVYLIFNQGWIRDLERDFHFARVDTRVSFKLQYSRRF